MTRAVWSRAKRKTHFIYRRIAMEVRSRVVLLRRRCPTIADYNEIVEAYNALNEHLSGRVAELEAVLTQAHEALKATSPYVDNRPWEGPFARAEGRTEAIAALRAALARPEFPDTEKG